MLHPDLIRKINSGRCFALVGSGPSCELGYPSWEKLAKDVWAEVLLSKSLADSKSYDRFISKKDYPAVFRQAETELGSRESLFQIVRKCLALKPDRKSHPIYEYLAKWPFACYLTTNFDSELHGFLAEAGQHYQVVQNRVEDMALLRDGVSHIIVKLHADLDHPDRAILTSQDYDKISTSPEWKAFRDKLRQAFEVFDVVIIGHSITDPDLQLILSTAKHTASPRHPIFMFLADVTDGEAREFLERYNIRLIRYADSDGSHRELKVLISLANRFVVSRETALPTAARASEDEILAASSILIFRNLQTIVSEEPVHMLFSPLVLAALDSAGKPLARDEIPTRPTISKLANTPNLSENIQVCIDTLTADGLVKTDGVMVSLTGKGSKSCKEATGERNLKEQQAFGQFQINLKQSYPPITSAECEQAKQAFRDCLVSAFRARGLALANVIITGQSVSADDLTDLFRAVTTCAGQFNKIELKLAFVEAAHAFLVEPNEPQRKYLASVSQGFFLYHLAAADPSCAKIRKDLFTNTCWFLDSSIVLPLLAKGCHNYEYACDFFARLAGAKASLFTTYRLLKETWFHLKWAMEFIKANGIDSPAFLIAAMAKENFRQNLFIDGYIRSCADGTVSTFRDYLQSAFPKGVSEQSIADICMKHGVHALDADQLKGFEMKHWGNIEEWKHKLTEERTRSGTFRNEFQVEDEAEVLEIIQRLRTKEYALPGISIQPTRVYFVSQSRVLDKVSSDGGVITWSPEAVYRYITTLPGAVLNPDLLQQCMLHEYYYAGISFIDKARYLKFFGPAINQAKLDYREQVDKYLAETEQQAFRSNYEAAFARLPDLEKPFFVGQMGWQLARAAEEKVDQATHTADARIAKAEQARQLAEERASTAESSAEVARKKMLTIQQEAGRQRNLRDPKHLRKRERQAKERARKKRK